MYSTHLLRCTFAVLVLFCLSAPLSATPIPLSLGPEGREAADVLSEGAEQVRDSTGDRTIETIAAAPFEPVGRKTADFGYTTDILWLRVRLANDGSAASDWRLHFRSNFLTEIAVWQVDDSGAATYRKTCNST